MFKSNIVVKAFTNLASKSDPVETYVFWYSQSMELVDQVYFNTGIIGKNAFPEDLSYASNHSVYAVFNTNKEDRLDPKYKGEFLVFACNKTNQMKKIKYGYEDRYINSINVFYNQYTNEVELKGFSGSKTRTRVNEIFTQVYDADLSHKVSKVLPITEQLVDDLLSGRRGMEKFYRGKKLNLRYRETLAAESGNTYVIYEDVLVGDMGSIGKGLFIMHYNNKHEIDAYTVLIKENSAIFDTYVGRIEDEKLHVFYETMTKSVAKFYEDLPGFEDATGYYKSVMKCTVEPNGKSVAENLLTYRVSKYFSMTRLSDLRYCESLDSLFFMGSTFTNSKTVPVSMQLNAL